MAQQLSSAVLASFIFNLFIYGSYNEAVSSPNYIASYDRMINE
jgi:hypothetical protein